MNMRNVLLSTFPKVSLNSKIENVIFYITKITEINYYEN